jgi:hypothetical protein
MTKLLWRLVNSGTFSVTKFTNGFTKSGPRNPYKKEYRTHQGFDIDYLKSELYYCDGHALITI